MYEMYSQNLSEFEGKFLELAILVKKVFLKKLEVNELIERRGMNSLITALAQKDGNETHAPVSSQDRPQDMVMVPRKKDGKYKIFCHFFNNWHFCKHGESCKYRHEDSPVCKQVTDCTNHFCQFNHSENWRRTVNGSHRKPKF